MDCPDSTAALEDVLFLFLGTLIVFKMSLISRPSIQTGWLKYIFEFFYKNKISSIIHRENSVLFIKRFTLASLVCNRSRCNPI